MIEPFEAKWYFPDPVHSNDRYPRLGEIFQYEGVKYRTIKLEYNSDKSDPWRAIIVTGEYADR